MSLSLAEDHVKSNEMALFDYNALLEEESYAGCLDEGFLEQKIGELEEIDSVRKGIHQLQSLPI